MNAHVGSTVVERPAHVPAELVRDVDLFNIPNSSDDVHLAWKKIQDEMPPIFWTPRNGGLWMITRAKDIEEVQKDYVHFSTRGFLVPNNPRPFFAPPVDVEPPDHQPWRMLISPAFSPRAVADVEQIVRRITIELIDGFAARGSCEFVTEYTKVLPIVVFLTMMQLPLEERTELLPHADAIAQSSDPEEIHAARVALRTFIERAVAERKAVPRNDLITKMLNSRIKDEPIPDEHVVGMCTLLLSGGLDTVKNMLGFCAKFLALNPGHADRLRCDPNLIPHATEELIRRHGVANSARLVVQDYEFLGVTLKAGEQLQALNTFVGLDENVVDRPLEVDFDRRAPIRHAAFGNGPHRCPGAILARREIEIWLQEWLPRIPEFWIKPGTKPVQGTGMVNSMNQLWLAWDPAAAVEASRRLQGA